LQAVLPNFGCYEFFKQTQLVELLPSEGPRCEKGALGSGQSHAMDISG
jgi:hypothetical protein